MSELSILVGMMLPPEQRPRKLQPKPKPIKAVDLTPSCKLKDVPFESMADMLRHPLEPLKTRGGYRSRSNPHWACAVRMRKTLVKYREAFELLGGTTTALKLRQVLGMSKSSVIQQLRRWEALGVAKRLPTDQPISAYNPQQWRMVDG